MKTLVASLYILVLSSFSVQGQSLDLWVIGSAGGTSNSNKVNLQWTLGEMQVSSIQTSNRLYTEGFHQPYIQVIEIPDVVMPLANQVDIRVFPNPASTELIISFEQEFAGAYEFRLYNSSGKLSDFGNNNFEHQTILDVSRQIPGTYWLQITYTDSISQAKQTTNYQIILQ